MMGTEISTEVQTQSGSLLAQIIAASTNEGVDAGKMKAMADLAIQLQDREQVQQFQRDYIAAVMAMPVISKDGRIVIKDKNNPDRIIQSTPFAKFEDLDRVVRPIARQHNLGYTFETGGELQSGIKVRCVLRHTNGHVERGDAMPLPIENSGSKNNVQGVGSTNSYGKRYALQNAFSIVAEGVDIDGHDPSSVLSLPHEREQLVLQEAEAAAESGDYQAHFNAQSPRDRAWLVQQGHHARLGGAVISDQRAPVPPAGQQAAPAPSVKAGGKRTPAQLVDDYTTKVRQCPDRVALEQLKEQAARFRDGIENGPDAALWTRIQDAEAEAIDGFAS